MHFVNRLGICLLALALLDLSHLNPTSVSAHPQSTGGFSGGINIDNPVLPGDRLPLSAKRLDQPRLVAMPKTFSQPNPKEVKEATNSFTKVAKAKSKRRPVKLTLPANPAPLPPVPLPPAPTPSPSPTPSASAATSAAPAPAPRQPMELKQVSIKEQLAKNAQAGTTTSQTTTQATATAGPTPDNGLIDQVKDATMGPEKTAVEPKQEMPASSEVITESNEMATDGTATDGMASEGMNSMAPNYMSGCYQQQGPWDSYMAQYMPTLAPISCAPTVEVVNVQPRRCCLKRRVRVSEEYQVGDCGQVWVRRVERFGLLGLRRRVSCFALNTFHVQNCCSQGALMMPLVPTSASSDQPMEDGTAEQMDAANEDGTEGANEMKSQKPGEQKPGEMSPEAKELERLNNNATTVEGSQSKPTTK